MPPTPRPSGIVPTLTALPRGIGAGLTEIGAFGADTIKAFGDVVGGYTSQTDPSLLLDPEAAAKRYAAGAGARADIQSGAAFSSEVGSALYGVSAGMAPNPQSANAAEQILFGLSKGLTKAVGLTVASGNPFVGATLTGASEGETEAEKLKREGVDIGTRTAVGAVAGAGAALGVAAPIAGRSIASTAALVAAGGPGAFVAQNAAIRAILNNAGYDQQSTTYDPFDPVGLAVSTLIPATFGALHYRATRGAAPARVADPAAARDLVQMGGNERRALRYNDARLDAYAAQVEQANNLPAGLLNAIKNAGERSNSDQVSSANARGVMQFIDATWRAYGRGDPTDPVNSIDAAGRYFADLGRRYNGDWRAAITEYNGGVEQARRVAAGGQPSARETINYLQRVEQHLADRGADEAMQGMRPTQDQVDAARVAQNRQILEESNLGNPDDFDALAANLAAFQRAQDQAGSGLRVDVSDLVSPTDARQAEILDAFIGRMETTRAELVGESGGSAEPGTIVELRRQLADLEARQPNLDEITAAMQPRRTYEVTRTRAAREQAQIARNAEAEFRSQTEARDQQINRLRGLIDQNARAEEARGSLAMLDRQLKGARTERSAIDSPGTPRGSIADAAARYASGERATIPERPLAVGDFGPIHENYRGDAQGAIARLMKDQNGEATAALFHPEVGDIDLVWGTPPQGKRPGTGLAKIVVKHPEVLDDLQGLLSRLKKDKANSGLNRVRLSDENGQAVVSLDWKGKPKKWLLTAYEKEGAGSGTSLDTVAAKPSGDTASLGTGDSRIGEGAAESKSAADALLAERPDMPVAALEADEGGSRTMSYAEAVEAAQAEIARDLELAPLMRVAANCFIANGAD
ncbi:lytic transglycosylase domain-containing protein [Chitinasiproducens palmae]|uniref:lytic transglycosylase domain-containing protein n=1 Tax=Chitinasiproducens palmae TaxID=1770053 RepID=UPI001479BDAE|nr:lytic transglycosylase domain-containing protein [Chitinasiproducens palmae]